MASTWATRAATCSVIVVTGFLVALYFYKRRLKKSPDSTEDNKNNIENIKKTINQLFPEMEREGGRKDDKESDRRNDGEPEDKEKEDARESTQQSRSQSGQGSQAEQMSSSMGQSFEFVNKGDINGEGHEADGNKPQTPADGDGKEAPKGAEEGPPLLDRKKENTSKSDKKSITNVKSMASESLKHESAIKDADSKVTEANADSNAKGDNPNKSANENNAKSSTGLKEVSDNVHKSFSDFLNSRENEKSPDTKNLSNSARASSPNKDSHSTKVIKSSQGNQNGQSLTNGCNDKEESMRSVSVKTTESTPKLAVCHFAPPAPENQKQFSTDEMADALLVSQNSPGIVSSQNAEVLVSLLYNVDPKMQLSALTGINRCSSFTRNQNLLREHGCLPRLSALLEEKSMSLKSGDADSEKFVTSIATAINNLSVNSENHKQFKDCVPTLVDITLEDETGESVCLSSLQALTNLSVTPDHHVHYTRVVQKLYDFLEGQHKTNIRLQAAKVLVNLSSNPELVPHMLAAKAPSCVLDLLKTGTDEAILLRWTTLLANILHTVKEGNLSASSLPPDDKAPSPETMYSALYGMNNIGHIKSKIFLLCRHRNEDIKHQASRIYQTLHAK